MRNTAEVAMESLNVQSHSRNVCTGLRKGWEGGLGGCRGQHSMGTAPPGASLTSAETYQDAPHGQPAMRRRGLGRD